MHVHKRVFPHHLTSHRSDVDRALPREQHTFCTLLRCRVYSLESAQSQQDYEGDPDPGSEIMGMAGGRDMNGQLGQVSKCPVPELGENPHEIP